MYIKCCGNCRHSYTKNYHGHIDRYCEFKKGIYYNKKGCKKWKVEITELEPCPDCGQTIDKGACFYCKMD